MPINRPPPDRQCISLTKEGVRCTGWAINGTTECFKHNKRPDIQAKSKEAEANGGKQKGHNRAVRELLKFQDNGQAFKFRTVDDVIYALAAVFNAVGMGELDSKTANTQTYVANVILNAMRDQSNLRSEYVARQDFKRILETTLQAVKDNLTDIEARKRVQAVFNQALLEGVDPREIATVQHMLPKTVQPTIIESTESAVVTEIQTPD